MSATMPDGEGKPDDDDESRLWHVDPSMYNPNPSRHHYLSDLAHRLKPIGVFGVVSVLFIYPLLLIYMGLTYGWVGFWGSFVGSVFVIGITLRGLGYNRNFQKAGTGSLGKGLVYLTLGFAAAAAVYQGLFTLKEWLVPVILVLLIAGLAFRLTRN